MSAANALARTSLLIQRDVYTDVPEHEIVEALVGTRVRLVADESNLTSSAARTALVTAFVLIAELGCEIWLDVPSVETLDQPPLPQGDLRTGLIELGRTLITPAKVDVDEPAALAIAFGDTPMRRDDHRAVRVSGDGFSMRLQENRGGGRPWTGTLPFGAMLSACAVAAEAFKEAMGRLGDQREQRPCNVHALPRPRPFKLGLPPFAEPEAGISLGRVDVISAGAITNAAIFALLRLTGVSGTLRVFDDDRLAKSNLNRYPLASARQLSDLKVEALKRLSTDGLEITGEAVRFDEVSARRFGPLSERVIIGVDHVPSRWVAQRHSTGWVGVGATSHFEVLVSGHPADGPCAGCLHPRDEDDAGDIPTVSFVSALAGTLLAYRLAVQSVAPALIDTSSATLAAPLNLAGKHPFVTRPVAARADCPVESLVARESAV
jgi:hypothetical protein